MMLPRVFVTGDMEERLRELFTNGYGECSSRTFARHGLKDEQGNGGEEWTALLRVAAVSRIETEPLTVPTTRYWMNCPSCGKTKRVEEQCRLCVAETYLVEVCRLERGVHVPSWVPVVELYGDLMVTKACLAAMAPTFAAPQSGQVEFVDGANAYFQGRIADKRRHFDS